MALLMVPPLDPRPWPTLGPQVCDWIEDNLVFGPGPLKGQPYVIEPEFRAELYRMYEVFPKGHPRAGRRRFKRAGLSKRKGTAKTEKAAVIAAAELAGDAPVRFDGWRRQGSAWVPVGRPVASPYIPMLAYTEEQSEDLAYGVLRSILAESTIGDAFDIGLDRIIRLNEWGREDGKAQALASSPNARDGALTTFQHFDETHRMYQPRLRKAHDTMLQNTFKRFDADAWTLETTTPGELAQESIARDTHELAEAIAAGRVEEPQLFYVHRYAPLDLPLNTPRQVRAALVEATGPATWSGDIDALVGQFFAPKTNRQYFRRVWLGQWVPGGDRAFDLSVWRDLRHPELTDIEPGRLVTLGFDGARRRDSTGLVATDVESGFQKVIGYWPRPEDAPDDWEVPAGEVDLAMESAFSTWSVWRLYADPPFWDEWVDSWAGRYGSERVVRWWTNRDKAMAGALRVFRDAQLTGDLSHDGDERYAAHIGNAFRKDLQVRVEDGDEPLFTIRKERPDSPNKIDLAMAGCLSWEARGDAIAAGATAPKPKKSKTFGSR
jgi:hypothetical protein